MVEHGRHHPKKDRKMIEVYVAHLDNREYYIKLDKKATGTDLMNAFLGKLDPICEPAYFGLYFPYSDPVKWVTDDQLKTQTDIKQPITVEFGVRFFPPSMRKLVSQHTKYLLFLQLKEDLATGKFVCPKRDAIQLCAYSLQADLGDYREDVHTPGYMSDLLLLPNQTKEIEAEIARYHKQHERLRFPEAVQEFLALAAKQDLYGVDVHEVSNERGTPQFIGVLARGITIYSAKFKVLHRFKWNVINELLFKKTHFILHVRPETATSSITVDEYVCRSKEHARALWASAVQHHTFFRRTRQPSVQVRRKLSRFFTCSSQYPLRKARVSSFRKTQSETIEEARRIAVNESLDFARTPSMRRSEQHQRHGIAHSESLRGAARDAMYNSKPKSTARQPEVQVDVPTDEVPLLIAGADDIVAMSPTQPTPPVTSERMKTFESDDIVVVDTADSVTAEAVEVATPEPESARYVLVNTLPSPTAVPPSAPTGLADVSVNTTLSAHEGSANDTMTGVLDDSSVSDSPIMPSPFRTPLRQGSLEPDFVDGMAQDPERADKLLMTATPKDLRAHAAHQQGDSATLSPLHSTGKTVPSGPVFAFNDSADGSFLQAARQGDTFGIPEDPTTPMFVAERDPNLEEDGPVRAIETIEFEKVGGKIGFTFSADPNNPTKPLVVKDVVSGGGAEQDGRLQPGDQLEAVNGAIVNGLPMAETVGFLKESGDVVKLVVSRECIRTHLDRKNGSYGLGFKGGRETNLPVLVSRLVEGSAAADNDALQIGREITHINGVSLEGATHSDVLNLIKESGDAGLDLIIHPRKKRNRRRLSTSSTSSSVSVGSGTTAATRHIAVAPSTPQGQQQQQQQPPTQGANVQQQQQQQQEVQSGGDEPQLLTKDSESLRDVLGSDPVALSKEGGETGTDGAQGRYARIINTHLNKKNGSYGLGFRGGADLASPVTISRIISGSAADDNADIQLEREITHIDGTSLAKVRHDDVLNLIKKSGDNGMDLTLKCYDEKESAPAPPPENLPAELPPPPAEMLTQQPQQPQQQEQQQRKESGVSDVEFHSVNTHLNKKNGSYGLGFNGGRDHNKPIMVSRIVDGSAAEDNEHVQLGREISHINGVSLEGASHAQVLNLIKRSGDDGMDLTIRYPVERPSNYLTNANPNNSHPRMVSLAADASVLENESVVDHEHDASTAELKINGATTDASFVHPDDDDDAGDDAPVLKRELIKGNFRQIPRGRLEDPMFQTCSIAKRPQNAPRNRYRDILPYDDARVKLQGDENDYFNGSVVRYEVGQTAYRYIACQGPKTNTARDFWKVVWDNSVRIIVMVTNIEEGGRQKCFQYWPDDTSAPEDYGEYTLSMNAELERPGFVIRDFHLRFNGSKRRLFQFQFLGWPDHGIPPSGDEFLGFVREVEAFKGRLKKPMPLLVHCSAGVGRSGVFILTELALALFQSGKSVNMTEMLIFLRRQRSTLVQTEAQFNFVHQMLEAINQQNGPDFKITP